MRKNVRNGCFYSPATLGHVSVVLLLHFLFQFAQGQGPGQTLFTVYENLSPGTRVGTIQTEQLFTYSFDQDSNVDAYFNLDSTSGVITTKVRLDRENLPNDKFDILVLAHSTDGKYNKAVEISIEVLDENDNNPIIPSKNFSIRENVPKGTTERLDTANDADKGPNGEVSSYQIVSGDGPFELTYDPELYGEYLAITVNDALDRESNGFYTFTIIARDNGSPPRTGTATVNIEVTDENDNPPIFNPSTYYAHVNETDSNGTLVIQVNATDRDIGKNQAITYRIIDDNTEASQFRIENSGKIFTQTEPLSCRKQCLLTVEARDQGIPSYTGRGFIYITVEDTNNHDPTITFRYVPSSNTEYSSINEDAKDGETVAGIVIQDQDKNGNSESSARIIAGNGLNHFRIQQFLVGQYFVRVNGDSVLDRQRYHKYNLTIEASDGGNPPRKSIAYLILYVNDINDNAPQFTNNIVKLRISELTPIGSFIASMLATDLDEGINAQLTYAILSGNNRGWFHINSKTGLVTTISKLHFNIQDTFRMNISVQDGALKPLKDYAELEISIWDENDMAPQFDQTSFNVSIQEGQPNGTLVVFASAVDYDSSLNGSVVYALHPHVQQLYPDTFYLDTSSGRVTTRKFLDREQVSEYIIRIIAHDKGPAPLTSTATVNLQVADINDNSPIFYPKTYKAEIKQGQNVGTFVAQVTATDLDAGDNGEIIYSITGTDYTKFEIDAATGVITTRQVLNKNDGTSYVLNIMARDKFGQKSDTASVTILVAVNDAKVLFVSNSYSFNIPEDPFKESKYLGVNVGSVRAEYPGRGTLTYSIMGGDPTQIFTIDSSSGWIRRTKPIDREEFSEFDLNVFASATDTFNETVVHIKITDVNDMAPKFEFPVVEVDLIENWPVGHHIMVAMATDADEPGDNSRIIYSLQNDANNLFGINSNTGLLYLNKPLKLLQSKSVTLTVVAIDSASNGANRATQDVQLKLKDVNNHSPRFVHSTYQISLKESHPVNSRFYDVAAVDNDMGVNGELIFNITRGNEDGTFGIFPDGYLYIKSALDRETKDLYKLGIRATDKGPEPRSSECNVTVHITDFNDNEPMFLNSTYSFTVMENKPANLFVGHVKASDKDVGRNAELSYYFLKDQSDFRLDSQTGELITLRTFDREAYAVSDYSISFDVVVKDSGLHRLQDIALVRVKILDENDNAPKFRLPVYKVTVFENSAPFSNVTVVKADDADAGINRIVTYDIISGNEDDNFMIDHTSGQIFLNKKLDRETEDYYELKVLATDSGEHVRHNDTAIVKVTVSDINDNFPLFAQSQMDISVREDLIPGTMVAHFPATDTDLGINAEITYTMSGIDDDKTFSIDRHTGKIYLMKKLDYERKKSYKLNVTATDSGVPPLPYYIRFSISIEDVNDNPPVFQNEPIVFNILEETATGSVGAATAIDADSDNNGEVLYFITFQDPPGDNFKIVRSTGQIYNDKPIDREVYDMVTLTVMAVDQADEASKRLSSETHVTIYIDDTNDNSPEITSFNAIAVQYGTPVNEFVATINATDKDVGNNGRLSLQLLQSSSYFGLESDSGRFYVKKPIPMTPVKYSLQVRANDYGDRQRTTLLDITVIITNNAAGPVFQSSSYSDSVTENSPSGSSILRVSATSRQGSAVEYYITNITDSSSEKQVARIFNVDKTTGDITTADVLDRETLGSGPFKLRICAVDTTGDEPSTSFITARIALLDQNDTPPRFSRNFYNVNVNEDVRTDFPVTKIGVYDDDSTGGLQLTINGTSDVNLRIRPDGTLLTTGPLDREQQPQYILQVTATDGRQSSTCVVRVNVLDSNDNAPKFEHSFYSFDIDEDTQIDTTVGSVRAHDADLVENGTVAYTLKSGWGNDTFSLDTVKGTFTLISSLHFEQTQLFTLVVMATDNGPSPLSSSVTVYFNVKDINDNKPTFELGSYTPAVKEDVPVGTSVVRVVALDLDSGVNGQVQYAITDGDLDQHFAIDSNSGNIVTNATLDRETTPVYQLIVTATDMAVFPDQRLSSTVEVSVTILDVNDYTPVFLSPSTIHVKENTPLTTVVHNVQVEDLDDGVNGEITYSISSKTGGMPFTISTDGSMRVNTALDRESIQNYTVNVTATDRGSPKLSANQNLLIMIEDVNDHAPVFSPEQYSSRQPENVKIGSTLLQVSAVDLDAGDNGIIRYYIIAGDENHDFSLDQSSGVLRVQKELDYERVTQYELIVQAEDGGDNSLSATVTVSVEVTDVNDNKPVFSDSPFIGIVLENMENLPVHVLHVLAHDDDSAPFNQLNYDIREGDKSLFNISASTGEIMALKTLDRETQAEYMLTVIATDSLTGRGQTGSGTVSIFVEDVNDNPPMFEHNGTYVAHIPENSDPESEVITVHATDRDEGVNAQILYSLMDNWHQFHILPDTGRITTVQKLDREQDSEFTLTIVARDSSMLPLSSTTTVKVYVDDVNDNHPVFDALRYSRTLLPAGSGSFVLGVTASDADIGDNGLVEYSLSSHASIFNLNSRTGVITLRQTVSAGQTYSFQVIAKDKGSPSLSASVPVEVTVATNSGITPPSFSPISSNLKIEENAAVNKDITRVTATSSNGAIIQYKIAGGNTGQAFRIGSSDGQLTVARTIDYEVTHLYRLWVEAYTSTVSNFTEVVIEVLDENDNSPRFDNTLYNVSVRENTFIGTPVVQVKANDADSGRYGEVSYTLKGSDDFFIDPKTGQITTFTSSLDREKVDMYNLLVVATDNGTPRKSSTASVRVSILDENDWPPTFERQFNVKIPENTEVGSFVIRVTTTDRDIEENAIVTYTLTDDANGIFMIDSQSGNITLKKPLDAEVKSSYRLRVSASDSAHNVGGNVEVEVSDINDNNPVLMQPYTFNFMEMMPPGSSVGQLKATDADISAPNNRTYFSLKQASNYFDLDSDTGRITSLEELTFDPNMDPLSLPNRHELVVIVKDLGTPVRSSETTVYINIVDYNDHAPVFEQSTYQSAVPDDTQTDNSILTVVARDEYDFGVNKDIEYFLAGGTGSQYFDVDRYSGVITLRRTVTGLRGQDFSVTVRAEDKGTPTQSATAQVQLVITGRNLHTPEFRVPSSKQISVPENKAVGSLIETFSASDQDTGLNAEIEYELTGGDIDNLFEMEKDTGKLLIKATLDYERTHQYNLNITAKDKGLYSKKVTTGYLVKLTDINDNDPVFRKTSDVIYIEENTPRGSPVYHALATDADDYVENAKITYAIVEDDDPKALLTFSIDPSTGVVTTKDDLDYETDMSYSLTIMAFNNDAVHKSVMSLTINIDGVNEYIPRFTQDTYYMNVSESAEEKTSVGKVTASDNDAGEDGIVYYFLIGDSNTKGFKIDARSGVIYVSGRPDYESSPQITLKVLAKNWGSVKGNDTDTCTVHISVKDANDPPVFNQDVYNPRILENSPAGTFVVTVTAADYDNVENDRRFSYRILQGNSQKIFQINANTGRISTTGQGSLDRELDPIITIIIGAVDTGTPPETGSATVNVHLDDVNDNGPSFTNFTASIYENQAVATLVTNLKQFTTDPDEYSSNPSLFTYFKVPGTSIEEYNYFDIRTSGDVVTAKVLDRESIPEFMVPVIVKDGGSPLMSTTLSFRIMVLDLNDSPPMPRHLTLFLSLYDGQLPLNPIADVSPFDNDVTESHSCNLTNTNSPFTIRPSSCDLMLNSFPSKPSYTLNIKGTDSVPDHTPAVYDVSVRRSVFDNQTMVHSTIIQLASVSANDFMKNSFSKFISAIQVLFVGQDEVVVFSLTEQKSGELLVFLSVYQNTVNQYYSSGTVQQKIEMNRNSIHTASNVYILEVGYSTCTNSYCSSTQKCESSITVGTSSHMADSPFEAFSYPELSLGHYCVSQCGSTYCQNNGQCINNKCSCPSTWTGASCDVDINECLTISCLNGANCINKPGSFYCDCPDGFSGLYCEKGQDNCDPNPCIRGTCKNTEGGFICVCPYGYHGNRCNLSSKGFGVGSYMKFARLSTNTDNIEIVFATHKDTALLLYNPSNGPAEDFVALEIVGGQLKFSVALQPDQPSYITMDTRVSTGDWFKVNVNRTDNRVQMRLAMCPADSGSCDQCPATDSCYKELSIKGDGSLDVGSHPMYFAGVKDIETILKKRPGQVRSHDFVGCVRSFQLNGENQLEEPLEMSGVKDTCPRSSSDDPCKTFECNNKGTCVPEWPQPVCHCKPAFYGQHCEKALQPFGFGSDSHVKVIPREDARRDQQVAANMRRRRSVTQQSDVMIRFRTTASEGLLLFASTRDSSRYSTLAVVDGQVTFLASMFGGHKTLQITTPTVNDGTWHNVTISVTASTVTLILDGKHQESGAIQALMFNSLDIKELLLGGATTAVTIDTKSVKEFDGCISVFHINGEALPLNGTTAHYMVEAVGGVKNGCDGLCVGVQCDGGFCSPQGEIASCQGGASSDDEALSIGIIVIIALFGVLIIGIIVVFVVYRQRGRRLCMPKKEVPKQNGTTMSKSANSSGHSHQDSGYGENNIDELIIRNHIAQELKSNTMHHTNGRLVEPDLIGSERNRSHLPYEIEDGTVIIDNASDITRLRDLHGEAPELYDLENASSIAPSDIDVVDHYRHFHDGGGRSRRKNKPNSNHSSNHHSQHSSRQYQPGSNHSNSHSHKQMRDSPNLLSSVPYMSDLARNSPAISGRSNQSPINQLSRQSPNVRQSPLTHVNMQGMPVTDLNNGSRTTSERSLASHRSKNSNTPHKPVRQMLPNGNTNRKINNNYENKQFLTLEEVDRLNSRPRESPASLMEAFSTSSENNTRKMKKPFEQYQDTSVLLEPPESSSDDSANDSFTCSEFEYENDKPKNDFTNKFSNLDEVDNENEDGAYHNKVFKNDGLDSGGNSFSSNVGSSDESHSKSKDMSSHAFNWDDLLNWGPKFEKLVGVFTDIALLPDADNVDFSEVEAKVPDQEEYV